MKKAILLVFTIVFALMACGKKANDSSQNQQNGNRSEVSEESESAATSGNDDVELDSAIGGQIRLSDLDESVKKYLIDQAEAAGGKLEFKSDGSTVHTDADGDISIQNPDNTWTYESAEGDHAQFGGEWPDTKFTQLLPKPSMTLTAATDKEDEFVAFFQGSTLEEIRAYTEEVKAKGFTEEVESEDVDLDETTVFSYRAKNADGYRVNVFYTDGMAGVTIQNPN
jgi:hypothetical protein